MTSIDEKSMNLQSLNSVINGGGASLDSNPPSSVSSNVVTGTNVVTVRQSNLPMSSRWSDADEDLLKEWAEHAICFHWLHEQSYKKFNNIYTYINIPIIIISTITGTANFAQSKINDNLLRDLMSMIIGVFSITAGILATSLSFFKIGERKESHNNCAKLWDKLHRNIQMELAKPAKERINKKTMMELTKKEYDRLIDDSPLIPEEIIAIFNARFKNNPTASSINKPSALDVFHPIRINHYDEPDEIPDTDRDTYLAIETKFRELNGRVPTDIELQNIMEMQRSSMNGGSGIGSISPRTAMRSLSVVNGMTGMNSPRNQSASSSSIPSLSSVSIPQSIRFDGPRDSIR
jgi:hypothetical protein